MAFDYKKMLKRELNVGLRDRTIRYGIGSAAALASVFLGNIPLLVIGAILLGTAHLRWCPVYSGMSRTTVDPSEEVSTGGSGEGQEAH